MDKISRRNFLATACSGAAIAAIATATPASAGATAGVSHTPAEWRRILGQRRYAVLREAATEAPFTSPLLNEHRRGIFSCAACALPLFSSSTKFDSGTGWPSFWQALPRAVITRADYKLGFGRTEVLCRRCASHLGHLFNDGPKPTGLRYCMNGLALNFTT